MVYPGVFLPLLSPQLIPGPGRILGGGVGRQTSRRFLTQVATLMSIILSFLWMQEWTGVNSWSVSVCVQDTNIGVPVTMRVDPKGYFVYWHDQNQVRLHNVLNTMLDGI